MAVEDARSVSSLRPAVAGGLDLVALEVGRVIDARVVSLASGMAVLASRQGTLEADLSSLGAKGAAVGDVLRLEVRSVETGDGSSKLTLALADRTGSAATAAAAVSADGPAQVLARAARAAATGQSGLAPLFASLAGLAATAPDALPEPVRRLVTQLMQNRLGSTAAPTAADVRRAFVGSGLFTESRGASTGGDPTTDLKVGLAALRSVLRAWVGSTGQAGTSAPTAAGDATAARSAAAPVVAGSGDGGRAETTSALAAGARAATAAYGPARPGRGVLPPDPALAPRQATAVYGAASPITGALRPAIDPAGAMPPSAVPSGSSPAAATPAATSADRAAVVSPAPATGQTPAAPSGLAAAALRSAVPPTPPPPAGPPAAALPATAAAPLGEPVAVDLGDRAAVIADPTAARSPAGTDPAAAAIRQVIEAVVTASAASALDDDTALLQPAITAPADGSPAAETAAAVVAADRLLRPPPPRRGQPTRGQAALPVDGSDGAGGIEGLGRRALERTDGALKRILLEQAAVLDRSVDETAGRNTTEWTAELPLATRAGTSVVQMTVERDGGRGSSGRTADGVAWRVRFSLDVEPLGPVHARVGLSGERLSIGLWVERPEAAARLAEEIGGLRGALEAAEIPVEGLHVAVGRPAAAKSSAAGSHFIDVSL